MKSYELKDILVELKNVSLTLGGRQILRNVNATVKDIVRPGCCQGQIVGFLGPSGIGKCVDASSYIWSEDGMVKISSLAKNLKVKDSSEPSTLKVMTDFSTDTSANIYKGTSQEGVHITLSNGMELKATPEHPIRVISPEGDYLWKSACDITLSDVIPVKVPHDGLFKSNSYTPIDLSSERDSAIGLSRCWTKVECSLITTEGNIADLASKLGRSSNAIKLHRWRMSKGTKASTVCVPGVASPDLAYLVGVITGDGCISKAGRSISIGVHKTDICILDKCLHILDKLFGYTPKIRTSRQQPDQRYLDICQTAVAYFLHKLISKTEVPDWLISGGSAIWKSYLSGILDTDGYVQHHSFEVLMQHHGLLSGFQQILWRLGIPCNLEGKDVLYQGSYRHYWRLRTVTEWQTERLSFIFKDAVLTRKNSLFSYVWNASPNKSRFGVYTSLSSRVKKSARINRQTFSISKELGRNEIPKRDQVGRYRFSSYSKFLQAHTKVDQEWADLCKIYDNLIPLSIASIAPCSLDPFDLHIPKSHTFIANGFVSHNTKLFEIMAGLLEPTSGEVVMMNHKVKVGKVGVVQQNYPLFSHRTIWGNLMLAASVNGNSHLTKAQRVEKVSTMLNRFKLYDEKDKYPAQLSGGQRQRIAIAQQLISSETFLLLDEPFSGLDVNMVHEVSSMLVEIANSHEDNTIIIVSHDLPATAAIADHLWVMGRDRDAQGNIVPGAYIKHVFDLIERELAWESDIQNNPRFSELLNELRDLFPNL